MLNEAFARAVIAERSRDREISLYLKSLHGDDAGSAPAPCASSCSSRGSRANAPALTRSHRARVATQPGRGRLRIKVQ
jgi:hypothetical protein